MNVKIFSIRKTNFTTFINAWVNMRESEDR